MIVKEPLHFLNQRKGLAIFIITLIDLLILLLFFYKLLLFNSPIFVSNFDQQISLDQFQPLPFWNPYSYDGIPNLSPLTTILVFGSTNIFMGAPSTLFGLEIGAKFFIIATTLILALSFNLLASSLFKGFSSKLLASVFFIANPFILMLYVNGDFGLFPFQSMMLLGIFFLKKSCSHKRESIYTLLAAVALSLSIPFFQAFYLGYPLYLILGFFFLRSSHPNEKIGVFIRYYLKFALVFTSLVVLILAPFILTIFFGNYNLSPSSTYALSSQTFNYYSTNSWYILLLKSYSPNIAWISVASSFGNIIYSIWGLTETLLMVFLLFSALIFRKLSLIILSSLDILTILLGAGPKGPLSIITTYLYFNLYGYQTVNASYYWDWLYLSLFFSLSVGIIMEEFFNDKMTKSKRTDRKISILKFKQIKKSIGFVFVVIALFVVLTPAFSQGYYNSTGGINEHPLPTQLNKLDPQLLKLIGKNDTGVAFFNPDGYFFFNNGSKEPVINPIIDTPIVRTAGIPGYLSPSVSSSNYFYWAYHLFYTNGTKYLGELMSLMAIQYFVVIYNSNPADFYPYYMPWSIGVNASLLMEYQIGISMVYRNSVYAIYKNDYNVDAAFLANNFTIVDGNYNLLNSMAYAGFNLSRLALVFASDINQTNVKFYLHNTNQIITSDNNLTKLVLSYSTDYTSVNPLNYIPNSNANPNSGWINSYRVLTNSNDAIFSSLKPHVITYGNNSFSMKVNLPETTTYFVKFKTLYQYGQDGGIVIKINNESTFINTSSSLSHSTNMYSWSSYQLVLNKGINQIEINSLMGFNSIGKIYFIPKNDYATSTLGMVHYLNIKKIKVFDFASGGNTVPVNNKNYSFVHAQTSEVPNGVYLNEFHSHYLGNIKLESQLPIKNLAILLAFTVEVNISISGDNFTNVRNFSLFNANLSNTWLWVTIPLSNYFSVRSLYMSFNVSQINISQIMYTSTNLIRPNLLNIKTIDNLNAIFNYSFNYNKAVVVKNTISGYEILNASGPFIIIREEFYKVMIPNSGDSSPILGQLNTLLILNKSNEVIKFGMITFMLFEIGTAISFATIISFLVLTWLTIKKR